MKSFFCSLAIFALMLCMIVCNYFYITHACDTLTEKIEALPPCEEAAIATGELLSWWEREQSKIDISISQHTVDKMNDCMAELKYAADHGDAQIFECARYRALSVVEEIRDAESLHPKNWI